MQEINWNNFRVKNKDPQKAFEELCYRLFCRKFNLVEGIRADFNEVGLETKPILFKNKYYGFQAKFFEHTNDAKQIRYSVAKAIKYFEGNLDVIYIYLNNPIGTRARYDKNIESLAKKDNVEIIWIVPSNLEIILSQPENQGLTRLYFSLGKTIKEFIGELKQHTQSILEPIHSKIDFNGNEIKIDRSIIRKDLSVILKNSSVVILSGEGGVGKTAVIKDFYNDIKERIPIFIFKAVEFNISNINDLFKNYGDFTLLDFINKHKDINKKYIIIDSAEKLSDLENQEAFQEFLSVLFKNKWKIIFTTRHSYLDDLKFQLAGIYRLNFRLLNIENIDLKELENLSSKYNFTLPNEDRLLELLQNPFYLNEYLQNYNKIEEKIIDYTTFKKILWNKKILNSSHTKDNLHLNREKCFLKIAKNRAGSGHFFVSVDDFDDKALQKLEDDEVIKYDSDNDGYFITHEIYEEWALEKIIERNFNKSEDYKNFFYSLGSSLPIRRAFRNWLSEQLLINQDEVKFLIEESIINDEIESFWKDEILVSVLLSDYSRVFFQIFENKLLENNQELLMRISFLIRIACKEIDEDFLSLLGLRKTDGIALKTLFTKPKGNGWNCVIDFIHKHKQEFGLHNINVILPLLDDWNNKNKNGETTKKASQIALYYYDEITINGGFGYSSRDEKKEQLIRVILQGASEITDELKTIFDEVISKKMTNYRDKYYEIVKTILSSITDNFEIIKCLSEYVIKLADLFWFQPPKKVGIYEHYSIGVEKYFGLSEKHDFNYFPASAFQTPVFQLLRFAPKETVDFILSFTNKAVECYAKSELNNGIEEVEVFIDKVKPIKQYISHRLWNMYRGTQVSTCLLESIHMALEKWLLENVKSTSKEILESWCLYLIKNSKSASITAVVTSIVLAQPSKLFNIVKILFQTKKFFLYDTSRLVTDQSAKSLYSIGYGLNYQSKLYQDERVKTCDEAHRKLTLEHIALNYQFLKTESESEDEVKERQKAIWKIFDKYYQNLPDRSVETESDKTWRLYLARMDRRKMSLGIEEKDGQVLIKFNPEIDPELKKFSEDSINKSSAAMKYTSLKLWSDFRFRREEDKYQKYQQYENNPQLVIAETKEIIEGLKNKTGDTFFLFNHSIPAYAFSVLIHDFFDKLNSEEKEFCKKVIIEYASIPLKVKNYHYQISDGTEPSIIILSDLIKLFPEDKEEVKLLLLLLLLNPWREISTFATRGVLQNLWEINFEDAHSIFLGYLLLKTEI